MLEFFLADANLPFATALAVMLGLAALEGLSLMAFGGLSPVVDAWLPDLDLDGEVDAGTPDAGLAPGPVMQALAWLRLGQVPALVWLVVWLAVFAWLGYGLQATMQFVGVGFLPGPLATVTAFVLSLPVVRVAGGWVARLVPREETTAVSRHSFVGRVAEIVVGTARRGQPAQARLRDRHGRTHYVMVEPSIEEDELPTGHPVLLVAVDGPRFRAIAAPSDALVDRPRPSARRDS